MKYSFLLPIIFIFSSLTNSAQAANWSDDLKAKVDAKVAQHFKNKSRVGLVVGVMKDNKIEIWNYGEKSVGQSNFVTPGTYFEIGSITKTYTATLLALEVGRKTVKLEDPVSLLWPELAGTFAGQITLEQLSTHHSGLPRMPDNFFSTDPLNPYKDYDAAKMFEFLKGYNPQTEGPYPFEYSNIGVGLLGYLLSEKLHQQSYGDYLKQNLLHPMGLVYTKTEFAGNDLDTAARGHDGFLTEVPYWDLNVLAGAGQIKSTMADIMKYGIANLHADNSELGNAMKLTQTPRANTNSETAKMGLGWMIVKSGTHTFSTHSGGTGGFSSNIIIDREQKIVAAVLSNTDNPTDCILAPVFDLPCEIPEYVTVSEENQNHYVGYYWSEKLQTEATISLKNGFLGIQVGQQPMLRMWPVTEAKFKILVPDVTIKFVQACGISHFTATQDGQTYEFVGAKKK
ncbi:MAG: serine hydrolase domain-containing protein [Bdellovibrionota bacterium]